MSRERSPLLPIFLIVLVDVLGFTIVIPLLPYYAVHFGATPLIATTLVTVYAVCSLISTPIIGKLSDEHGRKKLLMISQTGTCVAFIVLAAANSLWMLFLGRALDGLTAGNLSIAQAYISDRTAPENRAKAFGVIGVAFGLGFMLGPWIGGFLGEKVNLHAPFVLAACLSAFSIFCTRSLLPPEAPPSKATGPAGKRPSAFDWRTYAEYFGRPRLRALYTQFFLFSFAFSGFFSGYALLVQKRPELLWTPSKVGWVFLYAGLLGIVIQGGLLGKLVKRNGEFALQIAGFLVAIGAYIMFGFATSLAIMLVATTLNSFGQGVLRPVITSRLTQAVGREEQGVVLGISGSLSSVAMGMAPPTGGFMLNHGWWLGWALIPAGISLLGLLVTLVWSGKPRDNDGNGPSVIVDKASAEA